MTFFHTRYHTVFQELRWSIRGGGEEKGKVDIVEAAVVVREAEGIPIFEFSTTLMVLINFRKFCQLNVVQPTFINFYPLEHMEIKPVNPKGNQP